MKALLLFAMSFSVMHDIAEVAIGHTGHAEASEYMTHAHMGIDAEITDIHCAYHSFFILPSNTPKLSHLKMTKKIIFFVFNYDLDLTSKIYRPPIA